MTITYADIVNTILVESGQYISDIEATLLDKQKIELIIKRELAWYSRYLPYKGSTSGELYSGKVFTVEEDQVIPEAIIEIRSSSILLGLSYSPMPGPVHSFHWNYRKPVLYFKYPKASYMYSYIVKHEYLNDSISTLDIESRFINLVIGRFLMSVGKSRRAFTIDEIPIRTDASEMISEGKELYDSTVEEIRTTSMFNAAILT